MNQMKLIEKNSKNESFLYPDCEYSTDEEDSVFNDKNISTTDDNNLMDTCSNCTDGMEIMDTPFDGPIKIKISKDILNEKLIGALKRRINQRIGKNKITKLQSLDSYNNGLGDNGGSANNSPGALLKLETTYFITQVSFGGPI